MRSLAAGNVQEQPVAIAARRHDFETTISILNFKAARQSKQEVATNRERNEFWMQKMLDGVDLAAGVDGKFSLHIGEKLSHRHDCRRHDSKRAQRTRKERASRQWRRRRRRVGRENQLGLKYLTCAQMFLSKFCRSQYFAALHRRRPRLLAQLVVEAKKRRDLLLLNRRQLALAETLALESDEAS